MKQGQCGGGRERKKLTSACVTDEENWFLFGALSGRFLRFRQSMCSKTSGHACVRACVSPVHTERLNTWCTQLSTCLDRKVWDEHLPWGEQKAGEQSFSLSKFNLLTFFLALNKLVCHVFNTNISYQLTCVFVCMSTGQYSHMTDSPTSWNWLTQEVRQSVKSPRVERIL